MIVVRLRNFEVKNVFLHDIHKKIPLRGLSSLSLLDIPMKMNPNYDCGKKIRRRRKIFVVAFSLLKNLKNEIGKKLRSRKNKKKTLMPTHI